MTHRVAPIPAIVPAAGASRRMGQPKLLLEFEGEPLIGRVVAALRDGGAEPVLVVGPPADVPEGPPVARAAAAAGATVITPQLRPREMRDSVELAIGQLGRARPPDGFLLAPGDSPAITSAIVRQIVLKWLEFPAAVVVPRAAGRRAHPIVLPWDLSREISALPADQGINALLLAHAERIVEIEIAQPLLAEDLDSPADLERWRTSLETASSRPVFELKVRLFAIAKERTGRAEVLVRLAAPATVADLRAEVADRYPGLASLAPRVLVAVDSEYARDDTPLTPVSQVALIPPVSGGGLIQRSCP
jgi:molybdenum cofactor cytidylyltransferase